VFYRHDEWFLSICKDTHKPSAKANLFAVLPKRRIQGQAKDMNNLRETDVCEFKIFDAGVLLGAVNSFVPKAVSARNFV